MAERLIAAVLKTVDVKASQGSNPCVRASLNDSARLNNQESRIGKSVARRVALKCWLQTAQIPVGVVKRLRRQLNDVSRLVYCCKVDGQFEVADKLRFRRSGVAEAEHK